MRQAFGAAVAPEDLVGLGSAGALERDLLQLVLELLLGELAAFQARARLDDFFDVELEDVAPPELARGPLAPAQEDAEPAAAFLEREADFLPDLVVVGDRLFGFARKRNPD